MIHAVGFMIIHAYDGENLAPIAVPEQKLSHLNKIVSRDLLGLFFVGLLLRPSNQARARY